MPTNDAGHGDTTSRLLRHYDLVATASTAGVFLIVDAPWPLWAAWGCVLSYQIVNRLQGRR